MRVPKGEWGLNAPSGAGCFLTVGNDRLHVLKVVLMHLLVLGAF